MSNDITFCAEDCNNRMCFRHPSNISKVPHTFAYLKGTEACPMRNQEQRLIDANALRKQVNAFYDEHFKGLVPNELIKYAQAVDDFIDNAPTVDAIVNTIEVRPKGEWTNKHFEHADCSLCGRTNDYHGGFCKYCGADNRGTTE